MRDAGIGNMELRVPQSQSCLQRAQTHCSPLVFLDRVRAAGSRAVTSRRFGAAVNQARGGQQLGGKPGQRDGVEEGNELGRGGGTKIPLEKFLKGKKKKTIPSAPGSDVSRVPRGEATMSNGAAVALRGGGGQEGCGHPAGAGALPAPRGACRWGRGARRGGGPRVEAGWGME